MRRPSTRGPAVAGERAWRLRQIMVVVTVIGTAEAAIGLLLVLHLHLQRELGRGPLAIAPARDPVTIAVLWVLSALALAAILPIEQAALTEAAGPARVGRALGLYEATTLLAAAFGSLAAGIVYDAVPWAAACATSAAMILTGVLLIPWTIRRLIPTPVAG